MRKIHEVKIYPQFFEGVITQSKKFEIRFNDRNYQIGDILLLREFCMEKKDYTRRLCLAEIKSIWDISFIADGFVAMDINLITTGQGEI